VHPRLWHLDLAWVAAGYQIAHGRPTRSLRDGHSLKWLSDHARTAAGKSIRNVRPRPCSGAVAEQGLLEPGHRVKIVLVTGFRRRQPEPGALEHAGKEAALVE
jgi:hypothetical protein